MKIKSSQRFLSITVATLLGFTLSYTVGAQDPSDSGQPALSPLATPEPISQSAARAVQYLVEREGILAERILVLAEGPVYFPTLGMEYQHILLEAGQDGLQRTFVLLVDPHTGAIEPSLPHVRAAEEAAHQAKYGALDPLLYERLLAAEEKDLFTVAIWAAANEHARQPEELFAEVAGSFPEAEAALQSHGAPWVVEDSALAAQIRSEYARLLDASIALRTEPIVRWLSERGIAAERAASIPIVSATLTKMQLLEASRNPMVGRIFADDNVAGPASDVAVGASHIPLLWQQGLTGGGVSVGVVEPLEVVGTNINAVAAGCLTITRIYDAALPDGGHQSRVAAIVGCRDTTRPGVATGVEIFDGGYVSAPSRFQAVVDWATTPSYPADIVNLSMSTWPVGDANYRGVLVEDRVADYFARFRRTLVVVAAGNTTGRGTAVGTTSVSSPGKGWNVVTVGNYDDRDSAVWASGPAIGHLDVITDSSSYVNPWTGAEKPDLAAPGSHINTVAGERSGTSYAAPQVSGLAALLIQRNGGLRAEPEALRAILMASAVHNLDGPRGIPDGADLRDGAGGVNGTLAGAAAALNGAGITCGRSCWWVQHNFNPIPISATPHLTRMFSATQGEQIRVAIAWVSIGDAGYSTDVLYHNLDLDVRGPNGGRVALSAKLNSSEELVEFTAPSTGIYTIQVNRSPGDTYFPDLNTQLGIAVVKNATYLPDVRGSGNPTGYTSLVTIRNDGVLARPVTVNWINPDGSYHSANGFTLGPNQTYSFGAPANFWSSAVVDGGEDISVAVVHSSSSPYRLGTYTGISTTSSEAHIPLIQRNNSGISSHVMILNTGGVQNNVQVTLYAASGTDCHIPSRPLNPGERWQLDYNGNGVPCAPGPTYGAGRVVSTNNVPLAVVSTQYSTPSLMVTDHAVGRGNPVYAALVQNNNPPGCSTNCWRTGISVQNAWPGATTLQIKLRNSTGPEHCAPSYSVSAWYPKVLYPLPCTPPTSLASADFISQASPAAGVTATINQIRDNTSIASTYPAVAAYSRAVTIPRLWRTGGWDDALVIRNLSADSPATVNVYFHDAAGVPLGTMSQAVASNAAWTVFPPYATTSSAAVSANRPIAVTVNNYYAQQPNADSIGTFTPPHR